MNDEQTGTSRIKRMGRGRRGRVIGGALMLVFAAWLLAGHLGHKKKPPASATTIVTVAPPLQRDVREWDTYIGRFEPSRSVVIRPRVSGQVTGVHLRDGAVVTP